MDIHLIVDLLHTVALLGLATFCVLLSSELRILKKYVSVVSKNPAKARKLSFEKFKKSEKQ